MKKIVERLYVGNIDDYVSLGAGVLRYSVLGACKEPLHRKFARMSGAEHDGYAGAAMPRHEPEYLFAERDHALYLNLIDARDVRYIPDICIEKALEFIQTEINDNREVMIVCNQGNSRSPSIAFMYLIQLGLFDNCQSHEEAEAMFVLNFYPNYNPGVGMREYVKRFWEGTHGNE